MTTTTNTHAHTHHNAGPDAAVTGEAASAALPRDMTAAKGKPAGLPDKFWDDSRKQIRIDALIKSYRALEKKLSGISVPSVAAGADAQDGQTQQGRSGQETPVADTLLSPALNVPETPDDYAVDVSHGLFTPDPDVNARLHARGLTPEQVQEVYDLAAEKMVPMIVELAGDFRAENEIERLADFFGGMEKWREISKQLLAFGKKNLPADVLESLSSSYDGVLALYRMMQSSEPNIESGADTAGASDENGDIRKMMRDPRYWRDRDPAFVNQVTEKFRKLYG